MNAAEDEDEQLPNGTPDRRRDDDPCEDDGRGECWCDDDTDGDPGDKAPERVHLHVHPTHGRAHVTDGAPCWCRPTVTDDGIAVHREEN